MKALSIISFDSFCMFPDGNIEQLKSVSLAILKFGKKKDFTMQQMCQNITGRTV